MNTTSVCMRAWECVRESDERNSERVKGINMYQINYDKEKKEQQNTNKKLSFRRVHLATELPSLVCFSFSNFFLLSSCNWHCYTNKWLLSDPCIRCICASHTKTTSFRFTLVRRTFELLFPPNDICIRKAITDRAKLKWIIKNKKKTK